MRVEKLSREVGFITSDVPAVRTAQEEIRIKFAKTLAINGLRDTTIRRQLRQENDLTWAQLANSLKSHERLDRDDIVLCGRAPSQNVKCEPFDIGHEHVMAVSETRRPERMIERRSSRKRSSTPHAYKRGRNHSPGSLYGNVRMYGINDQWRERSDAPHISGKYASFRSLTPETCVNCSNCGECHYTRECSRLRCHNCLKYGHYARDCPYYCHDVSFSPQRGRSPARNISHVRSQQGQLSSEKGIT
jgi:hypothetical protein